MFSCDMSIFLSSYQLWLFDWRGGQVSELRSRLAKTCLIKKIKHQQTGVGEQLQETIAFTPNSNISQLVGFPIARSAWCWQYILPGSCWRPLLCCPISWLPREDRCSTWWGLGPGTLLAQGAMSWLSSGLEATTHWGIPSVTGWYCSS